ncbi:hypothetical protein Cgig2_023913 [Carnegiea gigantea]|uniref:Uncharacterized protein n=1 Tax=Carnegiea gigantea TaxID=171969 RepID=A0A9Q1JIY9_9CARY|nr:hypothetical protein Cgig2_023913 [Carnegiea gigantea]
MRESIRGLWFLRKQREPIQPEPRDNECSTKIVATIAGGYTVGVTQSAWKAQLCGAQQEVNPIGIIYLPLSFGDKNKGCSLVQDRTGPDRRPKQDQGGDRGPELERRALAGSEQSWLLVEFNGGRREKRGKTEEIESDAKTLKPQNENLASINPTCKYHERSIKPKGQIQIAGTNHQTQIQHQINLFLKNQPPNRLSQKLPPNFSQLQTLICVTRSETQRRSRTIEDYHSQAQAYRRSRRGRQKTLTWLPKNDQLAEEDDCRRSPKGDAADCKDKSAAIERRGKERRKQIGDRKDRTEESRARARARRRGDSERVEVESESEAQKIRRRLQWSRDRKHKKKKGPHSSVRSNCRSTRSKPGPDRRPKTENKRTEDRTERPRSGPVRSSGRSTSTSERPIGRALKEQKVNKDPYTLNFGVLITITVLACRGLIAYVIMDCGLTVQRRSLLVTLPILISNKRKSPRRQQVNLLRLSLDTIAPLLLATPLVLGRNLLLSGMYALERRKRLPCLLCTRQKKLRSELKKKPEKGGTLSTLRIILKNEEARNSRNKVVPKVRQLGETIERLSTTPLNPLALGLFAHIHYLGHEGWDRLRTIVFSQVILEVTGGFGLLCGQLTKWAVDWLPIVPV